jgi:beta-lactamase class A
MHAVVVAAALLASQPSSLQHLLEAELSRWPARSGVYVKHLATGVEAGVRAQEHFESASTIKVPIMVLAYRLAERKQLDLNARYEIKAADFRGGSGILKYHDEGLKPTLRDLITQMIITSDNTATDIVIAKVGGPAKLNEFLRQSGFQALHLNRTTYEFLRTARRADGEADWFGVAAPAEMGALLERIEKCTIAAPESCDEMKRILRGQQVRHKIPHYLAVPVANKTGDTGSVTNDVAIIHARSGPIVLASYNGEVKGLRTELDDRIGALARRVVDFFDAAH